MKVVLTIIVDAEEEYGYHTGQDVVDAVAEALRNYDDSLQILVSTILNDKNLPVSPNGMEPT